MAGLFLGPAKKFFWDIEKKMDRGQQAQNHVVM
jgi:hypothetical protein